MRRSVTKGAVRRPRPALVPLPTRSANPRLPGKTPAHPDHPHRRADDAGRGVAPKKAALKAVKVGARLMTDWPADKTRDARPATPLWYTKPYLLATLWGRLPTAPKD